jgi:hypothetical protein
LESDQLLALVGPKGLELVVAVAEVGGFCWAAERLKTDGTVVVVGDATVG